MTRRVYVCASSDELDRAARAMDAVRAEGWIVTLDWVTAIREVGVANPTDRPRLIRAGWARDALAGVVAADALWMLAPEVGHARGAFFEIGYGYALHKPIAVSGPRHACSIFTALSGAQMETDDDGLKVLRGWLR